MKKIKLFAGLFLREPRWFKILIAGSLLLSILFSSSVFDGYSFFQGASKAAAAIFFGAWGIKLKASRGAAAAMFAASVVCLGLAVSAFY
jgi:hypothetical protein